MDRQRLMMNSGGREANIGPSAVRYIIALVVHLLLMCFDGAHFSWHAFSSQGFRCVSYYSCKKTLMMDL